MDGHQEILASVCRVGGLKFADLPRSTKYFASEHKSGLKGMCVDIAEDLPEVHPAYICRACMTAACNVASGGKFCGGGCGKSVAWTPHTGTQCAICIKYGKRFMGGRSPKRKPGREYSGVFLKSKKPSPKSSIAMTPNTQRIHKVQHLLSP